MFHEMPKFVLKASIFVVVFFFFFFFFFVYNNAGNLLVIAARLGDGVSISILGQPSTVL